jgi:hypothetical protein
MAALLKNESASLGVAVTFGAIFVFYQLVKFVIQYQRRSAIIRNKGCQPLRSYPHTDPILGLDLFFLNVGLVKSGKFLPGVRERFEKIPGWTYSQLLLGTKVINTVEPENIKAILATQFKDFCMPTTRTDAVVPVFGHGIFTEDGMVPIYNIFVQNNILLTREAINLRKKG